MNLRNHDLTSQHPESQTLDNQTDFSNNGSINLRQYLKTNDSAEWHIFRSLNPEKKPKIYSSGRVLVIIYCFVLFLYGSILLYTGFMNEYIIFLAMGLENITLASILLIVLKVRVLRMAQFAVKIALIGVLLYYWYIASLPPNSHFAYGKFKAPGDFILPYITVLNLWIAYITKGVLKK